MSSASSLPPLAGSSTGAAKDINHLLKRVDVPAKPTRFLRHLEELTFGNAGFHRQWKHKDPGSWCSFDLASWSEATGLPRSTILRVRDRAIAAHIIWFEADEDVPGRGRIGWNLSYEQWELTTNWGGKREGAGRPKATNLSDLNTSEQAFHLENEGEKLIKTESPVAGKQFKMVSLPAHKLIKTESPPAFEPDAEQSGERSRIRRKEEDTEEETYIAADAAQGSLFPVLPIATKETATPKPADSKKERPRDELWDVTVNALGRSPASDDERGKWNRGLASLRRSNVTGPELQDLYIAFHRLWSDATCSPNAISGNLSTLREEVNKKKGSAQHVKSTSRPLARYL